LVARKRVVVFSIDGVPYSMLTKLIDSSELPNFARLAGEAAPRQMDSVQPTVSSEAWTSFVTGQQPGKHGIYGFVDRKEGGYEISLPLSTAVRSKNIWEILSDAGKRVFGMNVPVTYPPRPVRGVLIGGFLCSKLAKLAYPAEIGGYLKSIDYQIDTDPMLARRSKELMLPNLHETLERRMEAMFHFLAGEEWDYFHTHVMATDRLNHFLFGAYEAGDSKFADEFLKFYRRLDAYLGRLLDTLPADVGLLVLSDHGFCPIKHEVQLSHHLVETGWTVPASSPPRHPLDIDPQKSRAYSLIPGRIYVNLKGREPSGIVPPDEFNSVRDELAKELMALRAPNGDPVIEKVVRREELYWPAGADGPEPEMPLAKLLATDTAFGQAADLIAIPFDGYDLKMGLASPETFIRTELEGMHTFDDAVIMARGVELPESRFAILNLTRQILRALDVAPPEDLD